MTTPISGLEIAKYNGIVSLSERASCFLVLAGIARSEKDERCGSDCAGLIILIRRKVFHREEPVPLRLR
jgi:hypothetical protein